MKAGVWRVWEVQIHSVRTWQLLILQTVVSEVLCH